ncbi:9064_t:CDS:2, partial [Diversispora eburnea]
MHFTFKRVLTALVLSSRRISQSGEMNWFNFIGSAFSMGFVGIWAMHFIGMKALTLEDCVSHKIHPVKFNLWFTIFSIIIPIIVLNMTFFMVGNQPNLTRILFGGTFAGTCLGLSLCGLHLIASAGTSYFNTDVEGDDLNTENSSGTLIGPIYDEKGMILVTNEGYLPYRKITNDNYQQKLEEEFTTYNLVFHWIYRLTHDWESIKKWLSFIEIYIQKFMSPSNIKPSSPMIIFFTSFITQLFTNSIPYSIQFRGMFIHHAKLLSESLNISLEESGILYDRIIDTGIFKNVNEKGKGKENDLEIR